MAIEDAAALGIIFSQTYFDGNVPAALAVYEQVRLPRVTRVQSAAAKAAYNINERIGMCEAWLMDLSHRNQLADTRFFRFLHQYQHLNIQSGR